jgi:TPR repeat protein
MGKAVALFEQAARHERFSWCRVPHAQTALAICLYGGNGTDRDVARALKLFREAAADGNPQAQLHAGVLLWRGEGVDKDAVNAFIYLEAAAGNNEPQATEWRDLVAKELTAVQKAEGAANARSITTAQPPCDGIHGLKTWNLGLRLPNLKAVDAVP